MATIDERVADVVEPLVHAAGLTLYDVVHAGSTLRVLVDGDEGVNLDQLAELTRTISVALDLEDPIGGSYTLEVSSRGLERPLRRPDHFAGAVGEWVTVRTHAGPDGRRRYRGLLAAADETSITVDDGDTGAVTLGVDEIDTARTTFEWGPEPRQRGSAASQSKHPKGSSRKGSSR